MAITDITGKLFSALLISGVKNVTPWVAYAQDRSAEIQNGGDGLIVALTQDAVSVADYHATNPIQYSNLSPTKAEIAIDKEKYIAFRLEDTDAAQVKVNLFADAVFQASREFGAQVATDFRELLSGANIPAAQNETVAYATATGTKTERENLHLAVYDMAQGLKTAGYDQRPFLFLHPAIWKQVIRYVSLESGGGITGVREGAFIDAALSALYGVDVIPDLGAPNPDSLDLAKCYGGIRNRSLMYAQQLNVPEQMRAADRFASDWRSLNTYGMAVQELRSLRSITVDVA